MPVPLFHCFGCVLGIMAIVTQRPPMVIPIENFDPLLVLAAVQKETLHGACTACRRCSSPSSSTRCSPMFDLTSLRTGIMAGAPAPSRS